MTRDRALSTPIDVVLGLLLIGIATGVVVTAVPAPVEEPPADVQTAILGSSLTVAYETDDGTGTVQETVGGLLADAAMAGHGPTAERDIAFREATQQAIAEHIETHGAPVQVIGVCRGAGSVDPLVVGRTPPPDQPIRATVYEPPQTGSGPPECQPVVVLRRWSP